MQALPLVATAASTAFGVIGQNQANKAQTQAQTNQLEQQAKLAETRAVQKDLERRQELDRVTSAIKAARTSRGGSLISPLTRVFLDEANETIGIERLRAFAAERQQAQNFRSQAATARSIGAHQRRANLIGGGLKIGTSLFQAGMNQFGGGGSSQTLRSAPHLGVGGTF